MVSRVISCDYLKDSRMSFKRAHKSDYSNSFAINVRNIKITTLKIIP